MNDVLKTVLSNCDAKRDHNYREGADSFTITTREYAVLCEALRPEAAAKSAWIPVSERLPECDGWVEIITLDERGNVAAGEYWSEEKQFWPCNGHGEYWASEWTDITHWMPLPCGPQEPQGK